jgi:hypothetical protein
MIGARTEITAALNGEGMSQNFVGAYVTHAKLPELGSGEVLSSEKGTLRVRFAGGERSFLLDLVQPHLQVVAEAPAISSTAGAKAKAKAKAKPKAKKPAAKAAAKAG